MTTVLHVYKDYYPPVRGGIEQSIQRLCEGLSDRYDMRVLVAAGKSGPGEETINGVRVIRVPELGRFASTPVAYGFISRLKEVKADIIHFHQPHPTGEIAALVAKPKGKWVSTYHSDIVRQARALKLYSPFLRRFMDRLDRIAPTSPRYMETSDWLKPHLHKCTPVPFGIDHQKFAKTPALEIKAAELRKKYGRNMALFAGRLRYYKGVNVLILAAARIPDMQAVIIGDGPLDSELRTLARELGAAERIHFVGEVDDESLLAHYHACDVFCLPAVARSEAFGIVQLEAMACGKPVISTELGTGVSYVNKDGVSGLIVEPNNVESMTAALEKIFNDGNLREQLGCGARDRIMNEFTFELWLKRMDDFYRSVLNEG
jgi:glycosyltransferase involved in cell wall biosynthesis